MPLTTTHSTQQGQTLATKMDVNSDASTSTVNYNHEPYETFQAKALALAQSLFGSRGVVITLDRMSGGAHNRVVGININGRPRYILRIPREPDVCDIAGEAAAFLFVLKNAGIPAPVVVSYDAGSANAIGSSYVVHKRVEGECLYPHWWKSLSLSEKVKVAKQMGRTYKRIVETRNNQAGWPAMRAGEHGPDAQVHIESFTWGSAAPFLDRKLKADAVWEPNTPLAFSVFWFLTGVFDFHIENLPYELKDHPRLGEYIQTLERLVEMLKQMDARGVFKNVGYSLYHPDIAPRNIVYNWAVEGEASLTFLDWDEVSFMPTYMACQPPNWLWLNDRSSDNNDTAQHAKERFHAFHAEVGDEFKLYAYNPVYDILRKTMSLVTKRTVCSAVELRHAKYILAEWQQYVLEHPVPAY